MTARATTLAVAVSCLMLAVPILAQPPVPQWLRDINPSDYALLQRELLAGMTVFGEIQAEANAVALGVTDAQGNTTQQQSFVFTLLEQISVTEGDQQGSVGLWVAVLGTREEAQALAREHFGDYGMNPDWMEDENELGDGRITPNGGAVVGPGRVIICYRNIVANFSWSGALNEIADIKTKSIALLWLNKVAGPPGPDLQVKPDWVQLGQPLFVAPKHPQREAAADRQFVEVEVKNWSHDTAAPDVHVRLSVKLPGAADYVPIGEPARIGELGPGISRKATFTWDLQGRNVQDAELLVETWAPGRQDVDPRDNQCTLKCSIYFAHNGSRGFRWLEDSYGFGNYGYQGAELEELTQGLLATVIGQMYTDPKASELLTRLVLPQTYMRFFEYFREGLESGAGGHCYGLSATAGLYFMDPSLRPVAADTWNLRREDAGPNINLYQRAQMVPLAQALISGETWFQRNWGGLNCLNGVRTILRDQRRPVILSISGTKQVQQQVMVNGQPQQQQVQERWGHALLAYKLVEVPGRSSAIYVYDPNLPPMAQWPGQPPMSALTIDTQSGAFNITGDMTPLYGGLDRIAARAVTREVSLEESNAVMPVLKEKLREMAAFLKQGQKFMASLWCPADVVFTDPQGRRVGHVNGAPVNEVPGAEIRTGGEVEIYILPADRQYSVSITGTGAGEATLDIIRAEGDDPALTSFQGMPVQAGATLTATIAAGGAIESVGPHPPTLRGTLQGDRVTWQGGAQVIQTPPQPPTPPGANLGELIICRGVVDGLPNGPASSFAEVSEVSCLLHYGNLPATTAECIWMRDGQEVTRSQRQIGAGNGWMSFALNTEAPGGLPVGAYEAIVNVAGQQVRATFTIGRPAGGGTGGGAGTPGGGNTPTGGSLELEGGASSIPGGNDYSPADGALSLFVRYSAPGTIIDTVGLNAATPGDFSMSVLGDGTLVWQIWQPGIAGAHRLENGWHQLLSDVKLQPGVWTKVKVTWGARGMRMAIDGRLAASDSAQLPLSGSPLFFGDYPGDNQWTGYNIHQSFTGEVADITFE